MAGGEWCVPSERRVAVPGGRVWTSRWLAPSGTSDRQGGASERPARVVLHGGPGLPSYYLHVLSSSARDTRLDVVFYDQLGCGRSERRMTPVCGW